MIPYGRQDITKADIEAVVKVLRSSFLTQGPSVPAFEQKLCEYTSAKYAVAVNSCTSALHLSCLALGLGVGDILWTSPITFVASANCALYCGATVDFVDIEPDTALISIEKLKAKLEYAEKKRKLPKKEIYQVANELKMIIYNKSDFEFAETEAAKVNSDCVLFLQPEWSKRDLVMPLIVDYVMQNPKWKVSLQTHKYLNIP